MGFLTINNNVSLVSFQIAPSTFIIVVLALFVLAASFAYIHIQKSRVASAGLKKLGQLSSRLVGSSDPYNSNSADSSRALARSSRAVATRGNRNSGRNSAYEGYYDDHRGERDSYDRHNNYDYRYDGYPEAFEHEDYEREQRRERDSKQRKRIEAPTRRQPLSITDSPNSRDKELLYREKEKEKRQSRTTLSSSKKERHLLENGRTSPSLDETSSSGSNKLKRFLFGSIVAGGSKSSSSRSNPERKTSRRSTRSEGKKKA